MKAAVLRAVREPVRIEELDLAEPGLGEIRVRVEAAGVCHSDLHYMAGDLSARLPIVLGHEGAGIVEALGPGAGRQVNVGDRVALMWRPRCGQCAACVAGNPVLCEYGRVFASTNGLMDGTTRLRQGSEVVHHLMGVSCFAEEVVVDESSALRVPDGIPAEIAAISTCAVITGVSAVLHHAAGATGQPLVILGAGGVGLSAVLGAAAIGAYPLIVVDLDRDKLSLASSLGATHTVDASAGDPVPELLELSGGGAQWAVDAVGAPGTMQSAFAALGAGGTLVAVGLNDAAARFPVPINELVQRQKRVVGALYGGANPRLDLPRIYALFLAGRLPLDRLLGARYPLDAVNEAYADLRRGVPGRGILLPNDVKESLL